MHFDGIHNRLYYSRLAVYPVSLTEKEQFRYCEELHYYGKISFNFIAALGGNLYLEKLSFNASSPKKYGFEISTEEKEFLKSFKKLK